MKNKIIITPKRVLCGEKVSIQLKNFSPNQKVTIAASFEEENKIWSSSATFICNELGELDLNKDSPLSGSYEGIEPMGLFVYMKEENSEKCVAYIPKGLDSTQIRLSVMIDNAEILTEVLERYVIDLTVTKELLTVDGLKGTLFLPNKKPNQKVVICLSGSGGNIPYERSAILASHGIASLSLGYFGHEGLPKYLSKIPLEYFEKAFKYLEKHPLINGKDIAILGSSRGAELALLLASRYPQITSVVVYTPSHTVWSGVGNHKEQNSSAWSYQNKELPFIKCKLSLMKWFEYYVSKKPFELTSSFLHSLKNQVNENSIIAVEKIQGDILLISGNDDQMWCATHMANKIMSRLKKYDFAYKYTHLSYKEAGHFITIPYFPSVDKNIHLGNRMYAFGGNAHGDLRASEDSWRKVLAFLNETHQEKGTTPYRKYE